MDPGAPKDSLGPLHSDICPVLIDLFRTDVSNCLGGGREHIQLETIDCPTGLQFPQDPR